MFDKLAEKKISDFVQEGKGKREKGCSSEEKTPGSASLGPRFGVESKWPAAAEVAPPAITSQPDNKDGDSRIYPTSLYPPDKACSPAPTPFLFFFFFSSASFT